MSVDQILSKIDEFFHERTKEELDEFFKEFEDNENEDEFNWLELFLKKNATTIMKSLSTYITESSDASYRQRHQMFNDMLQGIDKLNYEMLAAMLGNLDAKELQVWIDDIKTDYAGSEAEKSANKIATAADLARFYVENPVLD